jgi:hypothetical protein
MLTITAYIEQTEPWSLGEREGWRSVRFKLAQSNIILNDMKEERIMRRILFFTNHSNP